MDNYWYYEDGTSKYQTLMGYEKDELGGLPEEANKLCWLHENDGCINCSYHFIEDYFDSFGDICCDSHCELYTYPEWGTYEDEKRKINERNKTKGFF